MTIFSCNSLTKSFDDQVLFENISFGIEEGERVGLIGRNGIGKTSLLKIIAGVDTPDNGNVVFNNNIKFEYLEQVPLLDSTEIVLDAVMSAKSDIVELLDEHRRLCAVLNDHYDEQVSDKLHKISQILDDSNAWNLENDAKTILSKLGINDFTENVKNLSGGLRKRVALAKALLSNAELLILDEPTNHLDADSVQWLQDKLMTLPKAIFFITHDRYFLDSIATRILEIDQKRVFSYPGNYMQYLERKEAFLVAQNAAADHNRTKLRTEMAWLERGARARRTKQKARIDRISKLEDSTKKTEEKKIKIELGKSFLGSRIIDAYNISKTLGSKLLFNNFTYIAKPGDRIGIIGSNGCGKSTLLNVLSGNILSDTGNVRIGESVKIGYYTQDIKGLNENISLVANLREVAEYIDCGVGRDRYITTKDLLSKFLFPINQHSALVSTLSGGEKKRLNLLKLLMNNPNVLLLDEPTNDLDIPTLNALEDYLDDFYGVLLIVSHDRSFLDRTVNFIYAFEDNGTIKEYPGNYSVYLEKKETQQKAIAKVKTENKTKPEKELKKTNSNGKVKKLGYQEQREFDRLEKEIPELENQKKELEELLNSGAVTDYTMLESKSRECVELEQKIDEYTMRWLELSDKVSSD